MFGDEMITQKRLKELLHYDPETGVFTRKHRSSNRINVGDAAGCIHHSGYRHIRVEGKTYIAHRLAWLFIDGYMPEFQIDHLNGIRDDNRFKNLRHVSNICNAQNAKISSNNTSSFPGVIWNKKNKKWVAKARINYIYVYLGSYENILDAALARFTAEEQCPTWTCNYRSELVKAIKESWPGFLENRQ